MYLAQCVVIAQTVGSVTVMIPANARSVKMAILSLNQTPAWVRLCSLNFLSNYSDNNTGKIGITK